MQIEVLRYFLEVVEQGSVRRAADTMNITPSAISRHIGVLENIVGAPLFERRARGMAVTAEGLILTKYARRMVNNMDLVKEAIDEIRNLKSGAVRIHAIEAVASSLLYPTIQEFLKNHLGISIEVDIAGRDNADVLHSVVSDKADIGIMYRLGINSELHYEAEFETRLVLVASPGHPLGGRSSISATEVATVRLAGLGASAATRRLTEDGLLSLGVKPEYTLVVDSFEMAKEFARTGVGVTILPEIAVRNECAAGSLVAIPFQEASLGRIRSAICTHKGRSLPKAAQAFLKALTTAALSGHVAGAPRVSSPE